MKYTVQLQFNVTSLDFADIIIEANSSEEAQLLAKKAFHKGETDLDYYQSDYYESELTEDNSLWVVNEH